MRSHYLVGVGGIVLEVIIKMGAGDCFGRHYVKWVVVWENGYDSLHMM